MQFVKTRSRHIPLVQSAIDVMADAGVSVAGSRVLIMCSGGLDSVTLVDVIARLPYQLRPSQIVACWLDHGMRSDTRAERDAARKAAERAEAVFVTRTRQAACIDAEVNTQDAARTWRYQQVVEVAGEHGCAYVLTAHTASDVAEHAVLTLVGVLPPASRIAALSDLSGFGGVSPEADSRALHLLRPLLLCTREQITNHAKTYGLAYGEDPTNAQTDYDRNYVRHEILPRLLNRWPGAIRSLVKAQQQRSESDDALAGFVQVWLDEHTTADVPDATPTLDRAVFEQLSMPMRQAVVAQWLAQHVAPRMYSRRHVMDIATLNTPRLQLRGGYVVEISKASIKLSPQE